MKKCPYCAEKIQDEAIKCRYCGEHLTSPVNKQQPLLELKVGSSDLVITNELLTYGKSKVVLKDVRSLKWGVSSLVRHGPLLFQVSVDNVYIPCNGGFLENYQVTLERYAKVCHALWDTAGVRLMNETLVALERGAELEFKSSIDRMIISARGVKLPKSSWYKPFVRDYVNYGWNDIKMAASVGGLVLTCSDSAASAEMPLVTVTNGPVLHGVIDTKISSR